ncbi:MAG: YggS family pyridoxal phosphate-dependent enzyme [Phycisphaerae bacterium]
MAEQLTGEPMGVAEQVSHIKQRIAAAAHKARRSPDEVTLVAVTKYATAQQIHELIAAGVRDLGESRVQQMQSHIDEVNGWLAGAASSGAALPAPRELRWHMIGHLQRNKANQAISLACCIHSIDSLRIAEEINELAARLDQPVKVLMEVNTSGEASKFGVSVPAATHLCEQIETMGNLSLVGLMTMAPQTDDPEKARYCFGLLRELFEEIRFHKMAGEQFEHLSMGMSGDFEAAIEEGATMVRIGTALFGPPPTQSPAESPGNATKSA